MKIDVAINHVLGQLPDEIYDRLNRIRFEHRPAPTAEDRERGATDEHRGYFYGLPVELVESTELPDEEPPRGVVVIFTSKITPLTVAGVARVLLHEIAHVLGHDEDTIVNEMGLG